MASLLSATIGHHAPFIAFRSGPLGFAVGLRRILCAVALLSGSIGTTLLGLRSSSVIVSLLDVPLTYGVTVLITLGVILVLRCRML